MKLSLAASSVLALPLILAGCGPSGEKTANIVQAATRTAAEAGQQLAEKAAELARVAPEEARAKLGEWMDAAANELKEIRDSETAQRVAVEVERALGKLVELAKTLGEKLDLEGLKATVAELIERFRTDPRVVKTLESLRDKLDALIGSGG
jgi:hypothetical protein